MKEFLVESADGSFVRKRSEDIDHQDRLTFDGPEAFRSLQALQEEFDQEVAAAGGFEAWRLLNRHLSD